MIDRKKLELFRELFDRSNSILIMCPNDALRDQLFAATSLYATLKTATQKNIKLFYPSDAPREKQDIAYLDEAQAEIGHENLCISLDYVEDSINEVTSHVSKETNKLYLTIKPKKGFLPPSEESVNFSYTGADADMIILVGVDELNSLGRLYLGYEKLFNSTALVSINSYETEFGNFKFDIVGTSCFSEFVSQMLMDLQVSVDSESATNLLAGINEETNGFVSYKTTADTFEIISKLIRAGARRLHREMKSDPTKISFKEKEIGQVEKKLHVSDSELPLARDKAPAHNQAPQGYEQSLLDDEPPQEELFTEELPIEKSHSKPLSPKPKSPRHNLKSKKSGSRKFNKKSRRPKSRQNKRGLSLARN